MSIGAAVFAILDADTAVGAIVADRISPYARNREGLFPAVTYSVPSEEPAGAIAGAGGTAERVAQVSVACMARRYDDADTLAEAVLVAMTAASGNHAGVCIAAVRWTSLERDFLDAYDGSVALIYRVTVNLTLHVEH